MKILQQKLKQRDRPLAIEKLLCFKTLFGQMLVFSLEM